MSSCIGINFYSAGNVSAQNRYDDLWVFLGRMQQYLASGAELSVLGDHGFWTRVSKDGGTQPWGHSMGAVSQGQFKRAL